MTKEAQRNQEAIEAIKKSLHKQEITYAEAKELAAPVLSRINKRSEEIAKKYNVKPRKITFTEIMR